MENKKHEIKHFIITNPDVRKQSYIASLFDVADDYICRVFSELNISPRKKPDYCVG